MDEKTKRYLQAAFEAPPPERKADFFRQMQRNDTQPLTLMDVLKRQIGYVRKTSWLFSLLLFAAATYLLSVARETPYVVGSVTPFFALIALAERARSVRHGMAEMESATRLSLRSILFARMFLTGLPNLVLLLVLARFCAAHMRQDIFLTGAFLLTPFLLTILCCLLLERSKAGRENPYAFLIVTALISLSYYVLTGAEWRLFLPAYRVAWEMAAVLSLIGVIAVWKKNLDTWEELSWN